MTTHFESGFQGEQTAREIADRLIRSAEGRSGPAVETQAAGPYPPAPARALPAPRSTARSGSRAARRSSVTAHSERQLWVAVVG